MIELTIAIIGGLIAAIGFTIVSVVSGNLEYDSGSHGMERVSHKTEYVKNALIIFIGIVDHNIPIPQSFVCENVIIEE
jgi:hypothetical protein